VARCTRHPQLAAGGQELADGRRFFRRLVAGVVVYLAVVGLFIGVMQAFSPQGPLPVVTVIGACGCFDAFCLADLARARTVRYLPKWGWVLACLASTLGGIMYLSAGRVRS
jgi:hypothetical protein